MDKVELWHQIKSDVLPALKADKHIAKPIGGGQKIHFYLEDGKVTTAEGQVVDTVDE